MFRKLFIKRSLRHVFRNLLKLQLVISSTLFICYIYSVGSSYNSENEASKPINYIQIQLAIASIKNTIYNNKELANKSSEIRDVEEYYVDVDEVIRSANYDYPDNAEEDLWNDDVLEPDDDVVYEGGGNEEQDKNILDNPLGETQEHVVVNLTKSDYFQRLIDSQNTLYDHKVIKRVRNADVFYISAIASAVDIEENPTITLNGWQGPQYRNGTLYCCFNKGREKPLPVTTTARRKHWQVPEIKVVTATKFICSIGNIKDTNETIPIQIGLSTSKMCTQTEYIKVEHAIRPTKNDSFAVCAKIVYGTYDAYRLFEWFGVNKAMGVDHVSLFTYNVSEKVKTVLNAFKEEGLVSFNEFDFPMKQRYPRHLGQKYIMSFIDEQVAVFDCIERHRYHAYIALIDVDEMIVPHFGGNRFNLKSTVNRLKKKYVVAAGFTLQTRLFILDWEPKYPNADFMIGQYTMRTRSMWDRCKSILIPSRVDLDTVWTHGFQGLNGYRQTRISFNEAILFHYRKCRPHWYLQNTCHKNRRQFRDETLKNYIATFRKALLNKRKFVLG